MTMVLIGIHIQAEVTIQSFRDRDFKIWSICPLTYHKSKLLVHLHIIFEMLFVMNSTLTSFSMS